MWAFVIGFIVGMVFMLLLLVVLCILDEREQRLLLERRRRLIREMEPAGQLPADFDDNDHDGLN